ncbi:MAG TPA: hypothetical protein VGF38_05350 [Ktedonobacterales bacterium]|jgi:hypothetical protein
MNEIMQNFLLGTVLPSTLFILLIALVAILGVARWPRTLLALALVALALRVLGIVIIRFLLVGEAPSLPIPVIEFLLVISSPIINLSVSVTTVGVFLALVLAARVRNWGWFTAILLAAIIGAIGANFAFSIYGLRVFFGVQQVSQIYLNLWYIVVVNVIAGLNILTLLLYALLGPKETTNATPAASMPDDPTLP